MKEIAAHFFNVLVVLGMVTLLEGCFSSSVPVKDFSELEQAEWEMYPIRALTTDTTTYTFDTFSYTDSTISGSGTLRKGRHTEEFEGTLAFSDIVLMEQLKPNNWKTVWFAPMATSLVFGVIALAEPSKFEIRRPGSCPFIYAHDGSEFHLEAEAFSTAISRALETETFHQLSSLALSPEDELKIRIKNERPETHLINSVHLFAADAGGAPDVALDIDNKLWPIDTLLRPTHAQDHLGNNIQRELARTDRKYWKSDLAQLPAHSGFRDTVVAQFDIPRDTEDVTLVIDAINSRLINEVYAAAGSIIGDQTMAFYYALEQDPDLQAFFRDWIQKSSLQVEVAEEDTWRQVGMILPEANEVPFRRAIRLQNVDSSSGYIKVRVSSLTDVWHIDAISMDLSQQKPLAMHPLEMISAQTSLATKGTEKMLTHGDSLYLMTLPPHHVDITFDGTPTASMQHPVYVFAARGYLYEWFPRVENRSLAIPGDWFKGVDQKDLLPMFRQHEDLFLQAVYARWTRSHWSAIEDSPSDSPGH